MARAWSASMSSTTASRASRPGVLVCHEGPGLTEHTKKIAARLAGLGYAAFAMDYHGDGKPLANLADAQAAHRCVDRRPDRHPGARHGRPRGAEGAEGGRYRRGSRPSATASAAPRRSSSAAAGCDLKAIVGFHSGLATARPQDARNIKGKVLVCIGADDPIIPPEQRAGFEKEMKAAGIDWRLQLYGGAGHSFTNPAADSRGMKGFFYHEATDRRSWNAMIELFNETLK